MIDVMEWCIIMILLIELVKITNYIIVSQIYICIYSLQYNIF